jgi:hypothetical protein
LLSGEGGECASGRHDDIDLERNQLRRENGGPSGFPSAQRYSIRMLRSSM